MYHSISDTPEYTYPYYHVNTSPTVFESHMRFLKEAQYSVINLQDLGIAFNNDISKSVILTFDDGFHDFYTSAFPIIKKYGFNATVFLPTGFIGKTRLSFKGKKCLTWNEVWQLSREGVIFGSHTVNHPQLNNLKKNEVEYEIKSSKQEIESKTGIKVNCFSYPFAFPQHDKSFMKFYRNVLTNLGYQTAVTTVIGRSSIHDDFLYLKRIPVNNDDDPIFFNSKLEGAYDWLNNPQFLYKAFKRRLHNNV